MVANVIPISSLSEGMTNCTIKGRCTQSDDSRPIHAGTSRLKTFLLSDGTDEVRVVSYDEVALRMDSLVQEGHWYVISNCNITTASKYNKFTKLEIKLHRACDVSRQPQDTQNPSTESQIEHCPTTTHTPIFTLVSELHQQPMNAIVNVVAKVSRIEPLETSPQLKRRITITDQTKSTINVNIFGRRATTTISDEDSALARSPVLFLQDASIWHSSSGTRVLSVKDSTRVERDPKVVSGYNGPLLDESSEPSVAVINPVQAQNIVEPRRQPPVAVVNPGHAQNIVEPRRQPPVAVVNPRQVQNIVEPPKQIPASSSKDPPEVLPPPDGAGCCVFISHAGVDKQRIAIPVHNELKRLNIDSFLDVEGIRPGDRLFNVLSSAIQTARIGVFILSPEFVARKWTFWELKHFMDRHDEEHRNKKRMAPIVIPVFHSWTIEQCKNRDIFDKRLHVFQENGFFAQDRLNENSTEKVHKYLKRLSTFSGIEFEKIKNRYHQRVDLRRRQTENKAYEELIRNIVSAITRGMNTLIMQ